MGCGLRWSFWICLFGVLLTMGCTRERGNESKPPKETVDARQVQKISATVVPDFYRSMGTVESKTIARIASKVMGQIAAIRVREGDEVKAGDVLVMLRSDELKSRWEAASGAMDEVERSVAEEKAAREEAQAQLTLSEMTYERYKDLWGRESISRQEFDQVQANHQMAQARLKRAEERVAALEGRRRQVRSTREEARIYFEYTQIKAPFSGRITRKSANEGDLAVPGQTLLTLEDSRHYQLQAVVDESKAKKITAGLEIEIVIDALLPGGVVGRIADIVPQVDPLSRTFLVKIDLPDLSGLQTGMYGQAYFPVGALSKLLVPQTALTECGQLTSLFVVSPDGVVNRRLITVGKKYKGQVEILSGLDPGEMVVVKDVSRIQEGCRLRRGI